MSLKCNHFFCNNYTLNYNKLAATMKCIKLPHFLHCAPPPPVGDVIYKCFLESFYSFITKLVVHNHCYRDNNRTYQHLDKKFPFFRMTFSERSWSALQLSPCSGITLGFDASFSIYIVLKKFTVFEKIPMTNSTG